METPHLFASVARWYRGALLVGAAVWAVGAVQAAGIKSERLLAAIVQETPESKLVSEGMQMKAAEAAAARIQGGMAFFGVGSSMEPLFASRTAIVVAPVQFKDLRKGMTVVYMNSRGRMVAHSLKGDMPKGWIAQGVGNDKEDDDLVTRSNLIGVIVDAYAEAQSDFRVALTKELVAKGRIAATTRT